MPLASLKSAGDEPLMLAYGVPGAIVAVAEDRYLAGVLAERRLGATVHVLDDGFQHVQLARDFDVLMTMEGEIAGGRPLPFGRLRESKAAAARADFVVVLDADSAAAKSEAWALGISQASAARRAMARAESGAGAARAVAVAGIARPEQFFAMLRDAGYDVASTMPFRDHHRYSASDIARIAAEAQSAGGVVLTTEKDEVRLRARAPLPFTCRAVPMTIEVDAWDALCESMEAAMARRRDEPRC
jgi:tetraacyldisaccharide 4'-kinase